MLSNLDCEKALGRGDRLPRLRTALPGPRTVLLSEELERFEAPVVNTFYQQKPPRLLWQAAVGSNILDVDGNRFLDLTAGFGVAALGHRHPNVAAAIESQAKVLLHGLGDVHAHRLRPIVARRLVELAPVDDAQVYWAISGSDAVEIALKTALLATGRNTVLAFEPCYHGLTLGSLAVTSRPAFRDPFAARLNADIRRVPFGANDHALDEVLDEKVGAVIVEPVVGREGILLPPSGWLASLAKKARACGALLIADEIFTGFGRTGALFAVDHDRVRPDLLCCGKALGGGMPIGAVIGRRDVLAAWATDGEALHTATFLANPLALAAANAVLDLVERRDPAALARSFEDRWGERIRAWSTRFAAVHEVRGQGALWGVALADPARLPTVIDQALRHGVLILGGGDKKPVLQLVPSLEMTPKQVDFALGVLEWVLEGAS